MASTDRRRLILEDPRTGRLYGVPVDECSVIASGFDPLEGDLERFVELSTGAALFLRPEEVANHALADDELQATLRAHGISGLRRVAAANVGAFPLSGNLLDPSWVAIDLGGRCGSRCSFCFTEWIRDEPGLSPSLVLEILDLVATIDTAHTVVFTGGEPTLRRDLVDLFRAARERGLTDLGLQTNGHRLAKPAYLAALSDAGMTRVLLSIHGATAETHTAITGVPASFGLATRALIDLWRRPLPTIVNFVVCRANLHEAERFVHFIDEVAPGTPIRFSYPIVEGAAFTNAASVLPSLPEFIAAVTAARNARATDGEISVANVPACVSDRVGAPPAYLVSQRRTLLQASAFYRDRHERGEVLAKVAACTGCAHAEDCGGLQLAYLLQFADAHRHVQPSGVGELL